MPPPETSLLSQNAQERVGYPLGSSNESRKMDESVVRLCSSVVVADVQALKTEVEIIKRSQLEEVEARKTGDALSGEAVLQLQAVVELEGKQRVAAMGKLEEDFQACLNRLYAEMSDLRRMFEGKVPGVHGDNFHAEVEREVRKCAHEFGEQLTSEQEERKLEDKSMHQLLAALAEQTNLALEEESSRIWDAIQSHNHDVILEAGGGGSIGNINVQTLTKPSGLSIPPKLARKINLSTKGPVNASVNNRQDGLQSGQAPPVQTLFSSSRSFPDGTGTITNQILQSQQLPQQSLRPPQQSFNNNMIMESFNSSLKTYPRIRVPGVYPE